MRNVADGVAKRVGLGAIEGAFLRDVELGLDGLPRAARRGLLDEAAELLSERPGSVDAETLVEEVGPANELAAELRGEAGLDGPVPHWRRWMLQSRFAQLLQINLLILLVVVGIGAYRWFIATPEIRNQCSGIRAAESEILEAAGAREYRTPFVQNARIGVLVCLSTSEDGVAIENITMRDPRLTPIQPVGVEAAVTEAVGDASDFAAYDPKSEWRNAVVWFEMAYCSVGEGASIGIDELEVHYRYRSRSRVTTIPLMARYSIVGSAECDDRRAGRDAEYTRWSQQMSEVITADGLPGRLTPLGIWPESVSHDLCRFLRGPVAPAPEFDNFEPLDARAVFRVEDRELAEGLIDGAVLGICPEFAPQRDDLVAMLGE